MRELKYYVAATVDGFIARADGSYDGFLTEGEHLAELFRSFPETVPAHLRPTVGVRAGAENRCFDAVLMGRHTYEVGTRVGVANPYPHLEQYVFSRRLAASPDPSVALVSADPVGFVRGLKEQAGKDIWLCGGGHLAAQLFPEIDEIILKSNPVLFGSGIPLFAAAVQTRPLQLVDSKAWDNGFRLLRYRVPH